MKTKAGTISISWGRYGGFYIMRYRICLGWAALTYLPLEIDDLMGKNRITKPSS